MAISLADVKLATMGPPRIVLYGVQGIGKSTIASFSPDPVFIPVEDGIGGVHAFPKPADYGDVIECINRLLEEEHKFKTVVLDGVDRLEPFLWGEVCKTVPHEKGKTVTKIEDYGYGKGYDFAADEWRNLLTGFDALRTQKGMAVVLVAHSTVARVEPPETDAYDRYQLRIHKKADAVICDWADAVLFANYKVVTIAAGKDGEKRRGTSDGSRALHTTERAMWRAKNRYGFDDVVPLSKNDFGKATLQEMWAKMMPAQPAAKASKKATAEAAAK